ncbi:hypothetical protein [Candidatus Accumulibacter aalborgensis]|uniref:hypothetical protein n=1 Tax=Candidatus Accumulibacter aalborgensis TaxID=1860102 RepID=UPI0016480DF6|nr:hypothetical protein [Candidatus Accumulibacter aalborgensis]
MSKTSRHAWLSSQPLSHDNVHERCNLGARHRWGIEAGFLVEKHQGYHYERAFALDWNNLAHACPRDPPKRRALCAGTGSPGHPAGVPETSRHPAD